MKALYIALLIFSVQITIFGQFPNKNFNLSNPLESDSNFVPLQVGNIWQYMESSDGPFGYGYSLEYSTVNSDTIIDGLTYYKMTNFSDYIRYSRSENKLYIRWNDSDYVHIDFNIPDGVQYQILSAWSHTLISVYSEAGEHNLLNQNRNYGGYLYIGPNSDGYQIIFTDSIGMSYDRSAGFHYDDTRNIIEAIVYDSAGIPIYFNDYHQPNFLITPITKISSADFNLDFQITHHYTRLPSVPGITSGVDFIDSVRMYSYYSKSDSIISNLPLIPNHTTSPVNINYNVSIQLDTILMIDGFVFNYRFGAKDRGIIPEYSNSPDTGYYQCVWETSAVAQEYYPLEIGNRWDYERTYSYWPNPPVIDTFSVEVIDDSLFSNGKTYYVLDHPDLTGGKYVRADSNFVYYYDENENEEDTIYRLNAQPGEEWFLQFGAISIIRLDSIGISQIFTFPTTLLYYRLDGLFLNYVTLSDKFGPVKFYFPGEPPGTSSTGIRLISCMIDSIEYSDPVSVEINQAIPHQYTLYQNYPNPFNPTTTIKYQIPKLSFVTLKIYDVLGRQVSTLVNEVKPAGNYEEEFNGTDLPSGIYFYRLQAGDNVKTKKMVLLK